MTKTDWAYVSNDLVYGSLFIYTIAFILYTYETAFAVRANKEGASSAIDRTKTAKSSRIATIVFLLATAVLLLGVVARGVSASRVPWSNMYETCVGSDFQYPLQFC
jgi:ABC-type transport system involved in cytochrome c biogenesis permease subunit